MPRISIGSCRGSGLDSDHNYGHDHDYDCGQYSRGEGEALGVSRGRGELRAIEQKRTEPRPLGLGKGTFSIPPSFFEPMPDEWLDEFYNGPIFPKTTKPSRVAEKPATYGARRTKRRR